MKSNNIKIVCISDTHCQLDACDIPEGDMIIHSGDALSRGTVLEFSKFINTFQSLPHKYKIYVPGNHDIITETNETVIKEQCKKNNIIYLNDSGIEIENIKLWGSGVTPRFHNWAWNRDSLDSGTSYTDSNPKYKPIQPHWDLIPADTDILITHGPPYGILDISVHNGANCGCKLLKNRILEVKPKYHLFGHIHHYGGQTQKLGDTICVNAAVCDESYKPTNKILTIEYNNEGN